MTARDDQRFLLLYEEHFNRIYAYCRRRASESAVDDLVADVFMTVWRRIDGAPVGEASLGWLYRIAYLVASNHWRGTSRRRRLNTKLEGLRASVDLPVVDHVVVRQEVRDALGVLEELHPRDREIIKLSMWEGMSPDEIAAVLDVTPETARQRLHRARKRLTQKYKKEYSSESDPPLLRKEVSGEH